ncbi:MAG: accB [Planctomycetota bacterium]|nr:accB [Planctomycetota bacterium]
MPEEPSVRPEVKTIRHLVRLMQRYDLTAIDLGDGPNRIRLRRRGAEAVFVAGSAPTQTQAPVAVPLPRHETAPIPTPLAATPAGAVIESPMVGTFYSSGSPDSPAFVNPGSQVRADTTVCIIEAMKVFTDIPAGIAGTIQECLVKNGQPVEFGQPLFRLTPA